MRRSPAMAWLVAVAAAPAALSVAGDSPWEIRRARTSDAVRAGGYPTWSVTFAGPPAAVDVAIDGDPGPARGVILVGRRLRVPKDKLVALSFAYRTYCAHPHRSGMLQVAVFTPKAWDKLPVDPKTEHVHGQDRDARPLWSTTVHGLSGDDVTEPVQLSAETAATMGHFVRTLADREVVLAAVWMAAHTCPERAALGRLHIVTMKPKDPLQSLLERLDLGRPDLKEVRAAVGKADRDKAVDALIAHFHTRYPKRPQPAALSKGAIRDAVMALKNRFQSCGSSDYFELGKDFDWHQNAIADKEWLLHLQWHHILRTLVQAGAVKNDPRYTQKAVELIRDWIPKNYPGARWSWRTLEVSLRAMNWTTIYPYLLHHKGFSRQDHVAFLYTLAEHVDYLLPPKRFHSGHNFGATESKALLHVGLAMPEFKNAKLWRDTAWERFEGEITAQVLADGAQRELTTGYHCGVMNSFFGAAQAIQGRGFKPSTLYWERLAKMHEYSMFLTKPDGSQPSLGDSWGGRPLRLIQRGGEFFHRPDMVFVGTGGREGQRPNYLDTSLPAAGYYVMRTSWNDDPDGAYLLLDAAHQWGGGHQHYDALGIILYAHGRTLTPDAGPFSYGHPLRKVFQSTAAHSTLCVDETNQNTAPCALHAFQSLDGLSFIDASHAGYPDVTHRRQILFARPADGVPAYAVVIDRVTGQGRHKLDLHFHLATGETVVDPEHMQVQTAFAKGGNVLVRAIQRQDMVVSNEPSWIMTGYGRKAKRPHVRFQKHRALPATFVTLLLPFKGSQAPKLEAVLIGEPDPAGIISIDVRSAHGRDLLFAGVAPGVTTIGPIGKGKVKVAGRAGLLRLDPAGAPRRQIIVGE